MTLPNQLTIIRIILAPIFLYMALSGNIMLERYSLAVYFIATLTDWYDGWYARKFKVVTKMGIFLDPLADKFLTTSAFILFYIKNIMPIWMLIIIMIRDIAITLLRSYDEYKGITMTTSFIAKSKTFLQMAYIFIILLLMLILTYDINSDFRNNIVSFLFASNVNYIFMLVLTIITMYTGVDYIISKIHSSRRK